MVRVDSQYGLVEIASEDIDLLQDATGLSSEQCLERLASVGPGQMADDWRAQDPKRRARCGTSTPAATTTSGSCSSGTPASNIGSGSSPRWQPSHATGRLASTHERWITA